MEREAGGGVPTHQRAPEMWTWHYFNLLLPERAPPQLHLVTANPGCWLTLLLRSISSLAEHGLEGSGPGWLRWLINSRPALVQGNVLLNGLIKTHCWIMAPWRLLLTPEHLIREIFSWGKKKKSALKQMVPLSWWAEACALKLGWWGYTGTC